MTINNQISLNQDLNISVKSVIFLKYFLDSHLGTSDNSENDYLTKAEHFLNLYPLFDGNVKVYNLKFFVFPSNFSEKDKSKFLYALIKFLSKINEVIVYRDKIDDSGKIVIKRQVNPDISVYNYIGNNDLHVKYSNNSYALLFDK